jgi:hypothetical protein
MTRKYIAREGTSPLRIAAPARKTLWPASTSQQRAQTALEIAHVRRSGRPAPSRSRAKNATKSAMKLARRRFERRWRSPFTRAWTTEDANDSRETCERDRDLDDRDQGVRILHRLFSTPRYDGWPLTGHPEQ